MLEEYQEVSQQAQDQLQQVHQLLSDMVMHLGEQYPEQERTWRMGKAMEALSASDSLAVQAGNNLHNIEWPTEDRPR